MDIDEQMAKWEGVYGAEIADGLRKRVEEEMPVYEYLRARRIRP